MTSGSREHTIGYQRPTALVLVALFLATFLAAFFFFKTNLGSNPTLKHDDYEYTYPSFSLVRHGRMGSPYYGNPINIAHRTYDLTVYYYAPVHAALIRIFGDDITSIPLANTFHFALIGALGLAYFMARGQWLIGLLFAAALWTDPMALTVYRTGRPEITCGFGIFVAALAVWERWGERNRTRVLLTVAGAGGVAAACSHSAGTFVGTPLFLFLIATNLRSLTRTRDGVAFVLPFLVVPALYVYFATTDSWQHITAQMATNAFNVRLFDNLALIRRGNLAGVVEQVRAIWAAFDDTALWPVVPGAVLALALRRAAARRPTLWTPDIAHAARLLAFFGTAFVAAFCMNCLCMKPFNSYAMMYKSLFFVALASSLTIVVRTIEAVMPQPLRRAVAATVVVVVAWQAYDTLYLEARPRWTRPDADYQAFGRELTMHLKSAGVGPSDAVYTPGPFASAAAREITVLAHPAEKYYWGGIPPSFHRAAAQLTAAEGVVPGRAAFVRDLLCMNPQWVVSWDKDEDYLEPFRNFLATFPNGDRRLEIRLADSYESTTTYTGTIWIYRVKTDRAFASSLERGTCAAVE